MTVIYTTPVVTHEGPAFETDHGLDVPETTNSDVSVETADEVIVLEDGQMMFVFPDIFDTAEDEHASTVEPKSEEPQPHTAAKNTTILPETLVPELTEQERDVLELTYRAVNGDLEAFNLLFIYHAPRLMSYAVRLSEGDVETARDVMQDVATVILEMITERRFLIHDTRPITPHSFGGYAAAIVRTTITRHRKGLARTDSLDDPNHWSELQRLQTATDHTSNIEEIALSGIMLSEILPLLGDAFNKLTKVRKELLIRRYRDELTHVEIGQQVGMSKSQVNEDLRRTLHQLRKNQELYTLVSWLYGRGD